MVIYLDNNATTSLDPKVFKAMLEDLQSAPLNPSSVHQLGQKAKSLLLEARTSIASYLQVKPEEILFTSGGTESMNLLIQGLFPLGQKGEIITTDIEHSCVHENTLHLKKNGYDVIYLQTSLLGAPTTEQVKQAITENTKGIILSAANTETGVQIDLNAISALALSHNIPLVIDGVALLGKEPFSIPLGVSAMGFSGHKIHGPKGSGFLFLRSLTPLSPLFLGGGQEFSKRAGTENLAAILGIAKAVELLENTLSKTAPQMSALRDRFEKGLMQNLDNIIVNGQGPRVSNLSNISFVGVDGEALLILLDRENIAASHGSACSSGALEPSRVLLNMGIERSLVKSSLRFSLSRYTTQEQIDRAVMIITKLVNFLRS